MSKLLTNENILNFLKENQGISKETLLSKFSDEKNIEKNSVKAHLYSLKNKHFIKEDKGKVFAINPFTEIYKEFFKSEANNMHIHLRALNARILEMVELFSPSIYERIKKLTMEAKNEAF